MRCPFCNSSDTKVVDSREFVNGNSIKRRRECLECKKRFTTYEKIEERALYVIKKDKSREKFDRNKIIRGLTIATSKRNISRDTIEEFVLKIERKLQNSLESEISTKYVGELVMEELKNLDEVAYVRFVSVYKEFNNIKDFIEIVENIKGKK
ncbi:MULTISPECIES: transcriptional regulator NrdR [Fusobacterium]|jgi:transcriptional repressor NrdR|uniref:transcriptional regulator NrdR n=1 Tax=Fusobacterium TaxID=848 RepID=UPI0015A6973D|nr:MULTISPECIES: transcriptional regulator NrdR [Fusobacterium]MCF2611959.1 transcriptional repressor NrdR [Fusobacterium perfoetens]MDY2981082.1 transcriptional regulator NrdR [Fusobacterium sp.]